MLDRVRRWLYERDICKRTKPAKWIYLNTLSTRKNRSKKVSRSKTIIGYSIVYSYQIKKDNDFLKGNIPKRFSNQKSFTCLTEPLKNRSKLYLSHYNTRNSELKNLNLKKITGLRNQKIFYKEPLKFSCIERQEIHQQLNTKNSYYYQVINMEKI